MSAGLIIERLAFGWLFAADGSQKLFGSSSPLGVSQDLRVSRCGGQPSSRPRVGPR